MDRLVLVDLRRTTSKTLRPTRPYLTVGLEIFYYNLPLGLIFPETLKEHSSSGWSLPIPIYRSASLCGTTICSGRFPMSGRGHRLFCTRIEVGLCRIVKPNLRENLFSDIG